MTAQTIISCLSHQASVRAMNPDTREVTFVAATETPVRTPLGPEILRMAGMKARAFVPFLRAHEQQDPEAVIGSLTWSIEGRELVIVARYDEDDLSDRLYRKVLSGSIRAVSVGWITHEVRNLAPGETDGDIVGPARIITDWTLIEVSQVALGADENALRRSARNGVSMATTTPATPEATPAAAPAPAPIVEAPPVGIRAAAQPEEDLTLRLHRRVRSMAGPEMRSFADRMLLTHADLDETKARALLLVEHARRHPAVGTPSQPEAPEATDATPGTRAAAPTETRSLDAESVTRALKALR